MSDIAIQIDHVWKKFRKGEVHDSLRELIPALVRRMVGKAPPQQSLKESEFWALKDVCFDVKKGESLGIIGPNGAGKSTMLKVLSRILKPNRGSYKVTGRLTALIEVGAGFHPDLSGRENIYLNGTILGMTRQECRQSEEAIIDFADIREFIDTPVKRYSSGMGARLGFAIAAHLRPEVLLVDEVLSVGDARFRDKCVRHMHTLLKSGITVVFISHILDQVRRICSRTIVLDKGQVVHDGETNGAIRKYLQVLDTNDAAPDGGDSLRVSDIALRDPDGRETLEWQTKSSGYIEFQLHVARQLAGVSIVVNISALNGVFLGTLNSGSWRDKESIATAPGRYRVRIELDQMPLSPGDYLLEFQAYGWDPGDSHARPMWVSRNPFALAVRGGEINGTLVNFAGQWQVRPAAAAPALWMSSRWLSLSLKGPRLARRLVHSMKSMLKKLCPSLFAAAYEAKERVRLGMRRRRQLRLDAERDFQREASLVGAALASVLKAERKRRNVDRLDKPPTADDLARLVGKVRKVTVKGVTHPVHYRDNVSDLAVIEQIFHRQEYAVLEPDPTVSLVIDAGANIGCATLIFLHVFPNARVISIEPDSANFSVLEKNVAPYGDRVHLVKAGVWSHSVPLKVVRQANKLDWGLQVQPCAEGEQADLQSVNLPDVMRKVNASHIDWLKLDIEGSERVIFDDACDAWLGRTRNLMIELHGEACAEVFERAMSRYRHQRSISGEYVVCRAIQAASPAPDSSAAKPQMAAVSIRS